MDIYIAKEHMDKLLTYVKNVADSKPRMYQKSKDRLRDIAGTCQKVIQIISEILQEEILDDCFEDNSDTDVRNSEILEMVSAMQSEILHLKQFVSYTCDNEELKNEVVPLHISNNKRISVEERKSAMSKYRGILKRLSETYIEFPQVSELCKLLHKWFETRFYSSMRVSKDFRYNIRRIPNWIEDSVVVYSNHVINDTWSEFSHEFYQWCDDLNSSSCKFAVPYEVYEFDKEDDKRVSLTSVVIWDILLDAGLVEICQDDSELYLSESCIYDMCMSNNPSELDSYRNYKVDRTIIEDCKLFSEWYRKEDDAHD